MCLFTEIVACSSHGLVVEGLQIFVFYFVSQPPEFCVLLHF